MITQLQFIIIIIIIIIIIKKSIRWPSARRVGDTLGVPQGSGPIPASTGSLLKRDTVLQLLKQRANYGKYTTLSRRI